MKILSLYILKEVEQSKSGLKMIRTLKPDTYYNFYKDIQIEEEKIVIPHLKYPLLYSSLENKDEQHNELDISICAIVGENGSGKSSIIDMIIRIINNLITYTFGESITSSRNEHFYYIKNIYAKLFVLIDDRVLGIKCYNSKISVEDYELKNKDENKDTYVFKTGQNENLTIEGNVNFKEICKPHKDWEKILRNFCHTIINNYSLHSFNPWSYVDEFTSRQKEIDIRQETREKVQKIDDKTDCCWLKGLFRRDDNYQIPLIITPARHFGNIDMEKQNKLSENQLLSLLLIEQNKDEQVKEKSLRKINDKNEIHAIRFLKDKSFFRKGMRHFDPYENLSKIKPGEIKKLIHFIKEETILSFSLQDVQLDYKEEILDYIGAETLKVICTNNYSEATNIINKLEGKLNTEVKETLRKELKQIWDDHSCITHNLLCSINYLRYHHIEKNKKYYIDSLKDMMERIIKQEKNKPLEIQHYSPQSIVELMPPPVFSIDFFMYENSDKKKVHAIPFSTLSSGEKQIIYILSSLFYHLYNIDSKWYGKKDEGKDKLSIKYKHVNIIFDEVELYFHPEMQRSFIYNLLFGLKQLSFENIKSIQIVIVTHSPFVLSDIPNDQILFLQKNGLPASEDMMSTFGANIHSILRHSFFLKDGAIGRFAQEKIKDAIRRINFYDMYHSIQEMNKQEKEDYFNRKSSILNDFPKEWQAKLKEGIERREADKILNEDYIRQLLSVIQEPIIKARISDVLNHLKTK